MHFTQQNRSLHTQSTKLPRAEPPGNTRLLNTQVSWQEADQQLQMTCFILKSYRQIVGQICKIYMVWSYLFVLFVTQPARSAGRRPCPQQGAGTRRYASPLRPQHALNLLSPVPPARRLTAPPFPSPPCRDAARGGLGAGAAPRWRSTCRWRSGP